MASGYEKINLIKNKLKNPMTVPQLAAALGCGTRTVFRHLDVVQKENCGLRKYKSEGDTFYVIQPEEKVNFNQNIVKQLDKIKKNMAANSAPELKTIKLLDKVIGLLQTTDPNEFKPEAISTDPDYVLDYGPFCDDKLQDALVNRVLKAIHAGMAIRIHYRGPFLDCRGDEGSEPGQGHHAHGYALPCRGRSGRQGKPGFQELPL